jgi:hypothetical protein
LLGEQRGGLERTQREEVRETSKKKKKKKKENRRRSRANLSVGRRRGNVFFDEFGGRIGRRGGEAGATGGLNDSRSRRRRREGRLGVVVGDRGGGGIRGSRGGGIVRDSEAANDDGRIRRARNRQGGRRRRFRVSRFAHRNFDFLRGTLIDGRRLALGLQIVIIIVIIIAVGRGGARIG